MKVRWMLELVFAPELMRDATSLFTTLLGDYAPIDIALITPKSSNLVLMPAKITAIFKTKKQADIAGKVAKQWWKNVGRVSQVKC